MASLRRSCVVAVSLLLGASRAHAQEPHTEGTPPVQAQPDPPQEKPADTKIEEKKDDKKEEKKDDKKEDKGPVLPESDGADRRKQQDYGVTPPSEPGAPFTYAGKVVMFPLWAFSEFVLRRPIGWLTVHAEKADLPVAILDFFTWGEDRYAGIFPSAFFDFGLLPSVGFNAFWRNIGGSRNTARLHFGTWGEKWINVTASDTFQLTPHDQIIVRGSFIRREDNPYFGTGTHSQKADEVRYGTDRAGAEIGYEKEMRQGFHLSVFSGFRTLGFKTGTCCSDPSLTDAIAENKLPVPTGYGAGYNAIYQRGQVVVDTRRNRPQSGSGARVEAYADSTFTTDRRLDAGRRAWIGYGGSVTGFWDVTGEQRVLSLSLAGQFADPLQGQVPFTDQPTLGGDNLMRGYIRGRLVDRSALVATLQYTWPVWVFFDGVADVSVGNVFDEHLKNWTLDSNRLSTGLGIKSNSSNLGGFEILFALGSEPFDQKFAMNSFRFFFGGTFGSSSGGTNAY